MSVTARDRRLAGQPLTWRERTICGVVLALGVVGHAALVAAAAILIYVVLVLP